jgi:hypothetical protein
MPNDIFTTGNVALISKLIVELLTLSLSIVAMFRREKDALSLWGRWTLITFLGFTAGVLLFQATMYTLHSIGSALMAGAILGIAQWFVLRSRLTGAGYWILATSIGFLASVSITTVEGGNVELLFGLFLGVIQILVLAPQYRGSGWWIFASTVGLGYWVLITHTAGGAFSPFDWRFYAIVGFSPVVYGALTGVVVARLTQRYSLFRLTKIGLP